MGAGARPVIPTVAVRTAAGSHLVVTAAWAAEAHKGGVNVVAAEDATEGQGAKTGTGSVPAKMGAASAEATGRSARTSVRKAIRSPVR